MSQIHGKQIKDNSIDQSKVNFDIGLQSSYDNSTEPEIETNTIKGAISIKRGSNFDTDNVMEIKNGDDEITAYITGEGFFNSVIEYTVIDFSDALSINIYSPNDLIIDSSTNIVGSPTMSISTNDSPYTLGDNIYTGDKITISVSTTSVVKIKIINTI